MKDVNEYYDEIKKMSLPELENQIKTLHKEFSRSRAFDDDKLKACLSARKHLINRNFVFTPEAINGVERINRILMESTAKVLKRTNLLCKQMTELKASGDDFLDSFYIEGKVSVKFNSEESLLLPAHDENNGQSDYVVMAEILEDANHSYENLREFSFDEGGELFSTEDEEVFVGDEMLENNWNIEELSESALRGIEYFCYASHILFVHSNYSFSDSIRINDIWNEVTVRHQNFGEKQNRESQSASE